MFLPFCAKNGCPRAREMAQWLRTRLVLQRTAIQFPTPQGGSVFLFLQFQVSVCPLLASTGTAHIKKKKHSRRIKINKSLRKWLSYENWVEVFVVWVAVWTASITVAVQEHFWKLLKNKTKQASKQNWPISFVTYFYWASAFDNCGRIYERAPSELSSSRAKSSITLHSLCLWLGLARSSVLGMG